MNLTSTSNRPAHSIRSGSVKAAIWKNEPLTGGVYFAITVTRSYQTEDGTWRDTDSLGSRDLLDLRRVITNAEQWIADQPLS